MSDQKSQTQKKGVSSLWHSLVENKTSRRTLFKGAAVAAAGVAMTTPLQLRSANAAALNSSAQTGAAQTPELFFTPLAPTTEDALVLPEGYSMSPLAVWGDELGGELTVGYNHDFTAFFPIDMLTKGYDLKAPHRGFLRTDMSSTDGILAINHEYVNPMFVGEYAGEGEKSAEQIKLEQENVGMTLVRVTRAEDGAWSIDPTATKYNRRLTALTPMLLTGPAAKLDGGPNVVGTLGNCSGGVTPWGTVLSCEENFQDYPIEAPTGYGWDAETYGKRHYGYIVEVDPYDNKSTPRKHTAMGRCRHENVAIRVGKDNSVVAYMGDDKADSCVYKFVAAQKLSPAKDRAKNLKLLETGKLYVADFQNGKWILLDYTNEPLLKDAKDAEGKPLFTSQADVAADIRAAALAVKATPMDRPEDIEIHPLDGSVYIALTNNTGHGNFHGQIVRLQEENDDPTALTFGWEIFATGGPQSGFSSPDNMLFDGEGNLWMVTDISSSRVGSGIYSFQGNNAMFFFRTTGPDAGVAYQFASGPVHCEMTGQCWTPDGSTMFLSVQHPGEESESIDALSSHWPHGGDEIPRPATVAITGPWQ